MKFRNSSTKVTPSKSDLIQNCFNIARASFEGNISAPFEEDQDVSLQEILHILDEYGQDELKPRTDLLEQNSSPFPPENHQPIPNIFEESSSNLPFIQTSNAISTPLEISTCQETTSVENTEHQEVSEDMFEFQYALEKPCGSSIIPFAEYM